MYVKQELSIDTYCIYRCGNSNLGPAGCVQSAQPAGKKKSAN